MAAKLVADLQRALEVDAPARRPVAERRLRQRLGRDVDVEPAPPRRCPVSTTVRQTPSQAIEAPRSMPRDVVGGADPRPQVALPRDRDDLADVGDDAGEHPQSSSLPRGSPPRPPPQDRPAVPGPRRVPHLAARHLPCAGSGGRLFRRRVQAGEARRRWQEAERPNWACRRRPCGYRGRPPLPLPAGAARAVPCQPCGDAAPRRCRGLAGRLQPRRPRLLVRPRPLHRLPRPAPRPGRRRFDAMLAGHAITDLVALRRHPPGARGGGRRGAGPRADRCTSSRRAICGPTG